MVEVNAGVNAGVNTVVNPGVNPGVKLHLFFSFCKKGLLHLNVRVNPGVKLHLFFPFSCGMQVKAACYFPHRSKQYILLGGCCGSNMGQL